MMQVADTAVPRLGIRRGRGSAPLVDEVLYCSIQWMTREPGSSANVSTPRPYASDSQSILAACVMRRFLVVCLKILGRPYLLTVEQ